MTPLPSVCLVVLDGWGLAPDGPGNAISLADTPVFDELWSKYDHTTLTACGEAVGLPKGQMGNSEVGHLNLGAGAVVPQDLLRIDKAVEDGSLAQNEVILEALRGADRVHLIGLVSDGGVHSSDRHLKALIELGASLAVPELVVHAFTDGRDTSPKGGAKYLADVEGWCAGAGNARVEREVHDRGGEHDVLHGVAERGDDAHRQHEQREGHDGVGDAADDAIGPAAEIAGGDAGEPAHQKHQHDRGDRDEEIELGGDDHPAEHVATYLIGSEPVGRRRRLERHRRVAGVGIVGNDERAERRGDHDQQEQPGREGGDRVFAEHVAGVAPQRRDAAGGADDGGGGSEFAHASILTRGSMTP